MKANRKNGMFWAAFVLLFAGSAMPAQAELGAPFWSMYVGNYWRFNGYDAHGNAWIYWNQVSRKDSTSFPGVDTYVVDSYQNGYSLGSVWFSFDLAEIREWREVFWDDGRQEAVTVSANSGLTWSRNPLYAGAHWNTATTGTMSGATGWSRPVQITLDVTVSGPETVFVPLGEYPAYRGHFVFRVWNTQQGIDYTRTDDRWFIPHLGVVKIETLLGTYTAYNELSLMGIRKGIADYTGSGVNEVTAYHIPTNQFFAEPLGNLGRYGWEGANCLPVVWDYDGDGVMEISIYHIPSNQWFVKGYGGDNLGQFGWGERTAFPSPGTMTGMGLWSGPFTTPPATAGSSRAGARSRSASGGRTAFPCRGITTGTG